MSLLVAAMINSITETKSVSDSDPSLLHSKECAEHEESPHVTIDVRSCKVGLLIDATLHEQRIWQTIMSGPKGGAVTVPPVLEASVSLFFEHASMTYLVAMCDIRWRQNGPPC
mmetsp:Transcript_20455/g.24591  ORF Transcript_20455/g.24591 Transcript_20455/m.24591 type:complete len:113 (-) Transcript_20455:144-482(-)